MRLILKSRYYVHRYYNITAEDVATVLVADINNRAAHGRFLNIKPEIGLLKSTARTFIQDGIKTEYVTKVIGTTIDNGQYVQLLTTTSRVLYNPPDNLQTKTVNQNLLDSNDDVTYINSPPSSPFLQNIDYIVPSNPYLVFPIRNNRNNNEVISSHVNINDNENEESEITLLKAEKLVEAPRVAIPQPNKVVPEANLPTYTVSHDGPIFRAAAVPQVTGPRVGKVITYEQEVRAESENKILPSVTYFGFADFTTTVGETVIIFSPSTAKPQNDVKDHVTSIKGEPTLNIKATTTSQHINLESVKPVKEEPRFTSKIVETALPTLPSTPKYTELVRKSTTENVPTTTTEENITTIESQEDEDEDDDDEEDETTTVLPPPQEPKIIQVIGVTTPESIESSQTSSSVTEPTFSKPSDEEIKRILESLNQVSKSSEIVTSPVVIKSQEPETKVLTGSSIIFFDDITTPKAPSTSAVPETTESDEDDDDDDVTTVEPTTSTTTEENKEIVNENLLVKPLTPKPETETEKKEIGCSSTAYKTLSYRTTFYIPVDDVITTTSVKSNKVVTSSVVPVDCAIKPTAVTESPASSIITTTEDDSQEDDDDDDEDESEKLTTTEKIKSTSDDINDTTQSVDNENDTTTKSIEKSEQISPVYTPETTTMEVVTESSNIDEETTVENSEEEEIEVIYKTLYTTYTYLTTFFQESTSSVSSRKDVVTNVITSTINANDFASLLNKLEPSKKVEEIKPTEVLDVGIGRPTEKFVLAENDFIGVNLLLDNEKVDYTPALNDNDVLNSEIKTLYTTYTYFTTLFNEGKSEVQSRTEVYTNLINPSSSLSNVLQKDLLETKFIYDAEKDNNKLTADDGSDKKEAKKLKLEGLVSGNDIKTNEEKAYSTMIRGGLDLQSSGVEESDWDDVKSSTSDGERSYVENIDRRNWNYEIDDQVSSESNTEERIPSPTLLLQTRYTTFTYYTTVFGADSSSNILSRLETLTNVVTETLSPTQVQKLDDATVPVTYFTTFTYWTTFYKDGTTKTTSREETVSNVVTPSAKVSVSLETALPTSVVGASSEPSDVLLVAPLPSVKVEEEKSSIDSSETPPASSEAPPAVASSETPPAASSSSVVVASIEATPASQQILQPSTYYTTYTYYTTNYVGDETVIDSRFETETNIVTPTLTLETKQAKAIDVGSKDNALDSGNDKNKLDGDKEKKEKVATIEATPAPSVKPLNPTGIVSINHGKIIDADGISTTHFTTQAIGTYIDNLYAEVIETSSSIEVDEIRKSIQPTELDATPKLHKTGLVRLVDGTIVNKNATTLYESKVIGTFIDGRYAQVIESTSSIIQAKLIEASAVDNRVNIEPTAAVQVGVTPSSQLINPTPAVLEGSISDTVKDDDDEDDSKSKFPSKKKGFTPVIRPFGSSRSRPSFNPKRKSSINGPAIITPTEIIPTIKATAVKGESSSRRSFSGPRRSSGVVSSLPSSSIGGGGSSSSRRSFVRPTSGRASIQPTASIRPSRTSLAPRIQPTSFGGARRPQLRSSLGISNRIASSSILPSINRSRIRPSASLDKIGTQATATTPEPDEFETTLITDEPSDDVENESQEPVTTTTENSRRSNNPLLRRRPPFTGGRANVPPPTQRTVTIATRRNPLARTSRVTTTTAATTTTPRTTRNRSLLRPSLPPVVINQNRQRTSGSLFPPRGLLQKTTTQTPQEIDEEIGEDENNSSEVDVEYEDTKIKEVKAVAPRRRSKRQTDYGTRSPGYNPRFKRPTTTRSGRADYYTYDSEELIVTETPKPRAASRYNPRSRSKDLSSDNSNTRIKPTSSTSQNNRLLFTLRDKDTNPSVTPRTSNFRRPSVKSYNSNRRTSGTTKPSNSRFRNYGQDSFASSRTGTNSNSRRTTHRNRATTRGTGRSRIEADPVYLPKFDGTITATHHIPTEVTIPVVVGKNTEYKNVITAKISTEVLGPKQYSTSTGNNGLTTLVILEEKTAVNQNGLTEITQYLLSETPTTSIIFTPTTIRGRKTSFSHVIPSTVYDAHPVVSTVQPQGLANNAPLANILLSQLLLGNIGFNQPQAAYNPLLGLQQPQYLQAQHQIATTPVTEFKTRTTTYVTTLHEGRSTVLPITFRGSKIYTTIFDDSSMVITATEFITDTVVITPTQLHHHQPQLNSLLLPLLLQQQQQQQQQQQAPNPLQNINTLPNSFDILNREALESLSLGDDKQIQSVTKDEIQQNSKEEDYEDEKVEVKVPKKPKLFKAPTPAPQPEKKFDTSVITLYVSGRRPGEFSTVLSTVLNESPVYKRSAPYVNVKPSDLPNLDVLEAEASDNYFEYVLAGSSNDISPEPRGNSQETESLDFVLGDYNKFTSSVL
ncbi:CLUMA_CG017263, isoform A [Clunio marinus]|uniref:CLUMA_CG017263, isoform A n=1 Tax=Clunio marinus TaxID=568069 RepID=A0A1J1IVM4_9DIPT|nr:CLUMA_CG017263, isoform A [Clunio marinus]